MSLFCEAPVPCINISSTTLIYFADPKETITGSIKLQRFSIAFLIPISAATKPILLSASICVIDFEIFFIFILGLGLITFLLILSQYIFNLDKPWEGAPTSSAFTIASAQIFAWFLLNLCLIKIFVINLFDLGGCDNLLKKGYIVDSLIVAGNYNE